MKERKKTKGRKKKPAPLKATEHFVLFHFNNILVTTHTKGKCLFLKGTNLITENSSIKQRRIHNPKISIEGKQEKERESRSDSRG